MTAPAPDWDTTRGRLATLDPTPLDLHWLVGYLASVAGPAAYAEAVDGLTARRQAELDDAPADHPKETM